MSNQMIVRIQPELKAKVNTLAKAEGKSVSEVVRELLDGYVKNRDISSYIDDLWNRVGSSLQSRGVRRSDIQRAVKDARIKK
jgi:predicted DNA-binding protein